MTAKKSESPEAAVQGSQEKADKEVEKGFQGVEVDKTPDEHYTVAGVIAGKPTPEHNTGRNEQHEYGAENA